MSPVVPYKPRRVSLKPERIEVGDFIYCGSPYYRSQLEIPKEAGLVLENKRSNFRVLYGEDQFCWLPAQAIVRVAGEINTQTLAGRLHHIIKTLKALDCELVSEGRVHRATLRIDRLDATLVDQIRQFLGENFLSFSVVPEGMAFMLAEIRFEA